MRKTSLALAVAASTLGLSQVAFADFIGDSKASLTMRNFYFDNDVKNTVSTGRTTDANYKKQRCSS